ncbi:MAG: hypothetical protein Q9225_000335 [Loekoesia sp. 1 TL-2023]
MVGLLLPSKSIRKLTREGMDPLPPPKKVARSMPSDSASLPEDISSICGEPPQSENDSDIDMQPAPLSGEASRKRSSSSLSSLSGETEEISSVDEESAPAKRLRRSSSAFQASYDDDFGLERPPPFFNLEGEWNFDPTTGVCIASLSQFHVGVDNSLQRRSYYGKSKKLFPFHHEPVIYVNQEACSNSAVQVMGKINDMKKELEEGSFEDLIYVEQEAQRLQKVQYFVQESAALGEWDPSGKKRSLEARMEDLLKKYGYDEMERKLAKGKGKFVTPGFGV